MAEAYHGQIRPFKQPDGTTVEVKLYGNEYYMRAEGLDGYTLIRDKTTSWICYASLSADGKELVSTGLIYKASQANLEQEKKVLPFSQHLDINKEARAAIIDQNKLATGAVKYDPIARKIVDNSIDKSLRATPVHDVSGHIKGLCIVIDFSDEPGTLPMTEFEDFCNSMTYSNFGNNGSLRKYYHDMSGGLLDYENVVFGYYRPALTFAQYDLMPYATGAQLILGEALNWIESQGFDFSTLSINPDGTIRAINLMYTGNPPNWAQGMWFHKGYYNSFMADGVKSGDYNCSPAASPLGIGTVAHENGHMIGKWPDTYKYDSDHGNDGIGAFDLMCWYGSQENPVPPNPLFRSNVGWGRVVDVTGYNGLNIDTANSSTCYKYTNLNDTTEFFLLESRMQTGRSDDIDDEGLTIWHIDRKGNNQSWHHEVYLVHANNNYANHSQACFRSGFNDEYAASTIPASAFYNGDASGLRVWDIGPKGNIMQYKLGLGVAGPSLKVLYNSTGNDSNGNGSFEAGESAEISVNGTNIGQTNSGLATMTCTAVGPTATYVTINTPPVALGVVNVGATMPAVFNFSIDPATPVGTMLKLKVEISDGVSSNYITREVEVGLVMPMNNSLTETTCGAIFYDEGLGSNYDNDLDNTKTILPATTGQKIRANFLEFELEDEAGCGYDYLEIYNGPSSASPLIGTYCGTDGPGTVNSTHTSGALTFKFHSDNIEERLGWKALLSCETGVGTHDMLAEMPVKLFPNPSNGMVTLQLGEESDAQVLVRDITGRMIMEANFEGKKEMQIDLSGKNNGLYLVDIRLGKMVHTQRLVLQH